jgi:hypothetical protein
MIHPGGVMEFAVGQTNARVAVGLSVAGSDGLFTSMDHAILLRENGTFQIYERGAAVTAPRPYRAGNIFSLRVAVVGGLHVVSYVQLDEEVHATQDVAPKFPLEGRVLFSHQPANIIRATITPFSPDQFDEIKPEEVADGVLELSRIGGPTDPQKAVGYNVYRSTDPNLPKKRWERLNATLLSQPDFKDTKRRPGVRYYYYSTSVNAYGVESGPSDVIGPDDAAQDLGDKVM